MNYDITFFHTSEVHIKTFDALIKKHAPELKVFHAVKESFLSEAMANGLTNQLKTEIEYFLSNLAMSKLIICTCSTLGGIVEKPNTRFKRIDRAMADQAISIGKNIRVVAALKSTLEPTRLLINTSAFYQNKHINLNIEYIADAWQHFENSDMELYYKVISDHINNIQNVDVIVLAQASMTGCIQYTSTEIPILSGPELGVIEAICHLNK